MTAVIPQLRRLPGLRVRAAVTCCSRLPLTAGSLFRQEQPRQDSRPQDDHSLFLASLFLATGAVATATRFTHCAEEPAVGRRLPVGKESDYRDGELRQVRVPATGPGGDIGEILVARIDGKFYATGASCSHYSAPLAGGVLAKDKMCVVCPWHDAAFDIRTGMPVRGPALEAIPTYPVSVEGEQVIVDLPNNLQDFVTPPTTRRSLEDKRVFVIVGGGAAGVAAADTLRQEGFTGRLVFITDEKHLPYDRPVLSKNLAKGADPESLSLRDAAYFEAHDIEFKRSAPVVELDASRRSVKLESGEELIYDCALVATGAKPRALPIPGGSLPGVFALRTPEDAQRIASACPSGKRVVVIGSSFIGMEIAATLKKRGCEVTVLGMEAVPFERVLGSKVGQSVKTFFESKGVTFLGKSVVKEIQQAGEAGGLTAILSSGSALPCDAIVVGVGVVPNAGYVKGTQMAKDGSLLTDECLQCTAPGLFAAGDVATYRASDSGETRRVEHWQVASSQGRAAAKTMLGKREACDLTPFFWTSLFGKNLRYVGHCLKFDDLIVEGDIAKLNFVAYYCEGGDVKAVATMARDPIAVAAGELIRMGKMPKAEEFKKGRIKGAALAGELERMK